MRAAGLALHLALTLAVFGAIYLINVALPASLGVVLGLLFGIGAASVIALVSHAIAVRREQREHEEWQRWRDDAARMESLIERAQASLLHRHEERLRQVHDVRDGRVRGQPTAGQQPRQLPGLRQAGAGDEGEGG